ncbi:ATP-dependent zinc protease family protein [Erythrobacter rubeus]|uniref:ATP-dependent zinc protease n=1 Tax=Erythrobacter rubeus TaxID=2760803 RepID=A0ABR8KTW5_9SPHN|nr:RimK/LysX family protein [Erythrobacter rubeus]MBD2841576.1 ATP-dependent zinc protease [Erythrobacter rubeus]
MSEKAQSLPTVGWRECVDLPGLGITNIPAKIDTGARTSSLHGHVIETFERDGRTFVRFSVDWDDIELECEAVQVDRRGITSSNGETQQRYVIKTPVRIGGAEFRAEFSLADRSEMKFPILIGRTALRRRFVVDSGRSWLQSRA